jgi:hypothetical protein
MINILTYYKIIIKNIIYKLYSNNKIKLLLMVKSYNYKHLIYFHKQKIIII